MRTAFFGGTFDPPHSGHIAIVKAVLERKLADRVMLAPALNPPHKMGTVHSPFEDRLRMTELAAEELENVIVTDEEKRTPGASYTLSILDRLSEENPGQHFSFIIGGDSLLSLHTWHKAGELVEKYGVIVYPRPGENITMETLCLHWPRETAEKLYSCVLRDVRKDVSGSTGIREAVRQGKIPENVCRKVYEYIKLRRLYR